MSTEPRLSGEAKRAAMEKSQREALEKEHQALEATRAKTARLRAQRLEREAADAAAKAEKAAPKRVRKKTPAR